MADVSVALATLNGARFLRDQLSSYERQTRLPAELVVSDDGSTDKTLAIIAEFAQSASFPVRILSRGEHLGFADNFLRTAKACKSNFIAFSDQDDVWLPRKLEEGLRRLEQDGSSLALHTSMLTDTNLVPIGLHRQGIYRSEVYQPLQLDPYVGLGWGNTMIFSRRLLDIVPIESRPKQPEADQRSLSHDTWIYVLAAAIGRVSHIDEPLCLYRQHEANAFGIKKRTIAEQIRASTETPLFRHQCRVEFYHAMAIIFDQLKSSSDPALAKAAQRAAETFDERRARLQSRIRVYTGDNISVRLTEFLRASRLHASGSAAGPRVFSRLKDLVLGVCGLGKVGR
jgi:Glycosyl transferase family 2